MTSDVLVSSFLSWQSGVFCLGLYFLVFVFRKLSEGFFKRLALSTVWNEVVLPILPIVVGALAAWVATTYPYPDHAIATSTTARVFFGAVCGGFSGIAYRVLKAVVKKQWGVDLSSPPGPVQGVDVVLPPAPKPPSNV